MDDIAACKSCPRLVDYLRHTREQFPEYHCKPVPAFGPADARLLIVGLAPGKHGANATGVPFTGDAAGLLLYRTLYKFGFASHPESSTDCGFTLIDCRITNAVKCLPPQNKPTAEEINQCNRWLLRELDSLTGTTVILALGQIAHKAIVRALGLRQSAFKFAHLRVYRPSDRIHLVDSYHCSRYNTQTGRLTEMMFDQVFERIRILIQQGTCYG